MGAATAMISTTHLALVSVSTMGVENREEISHADH